MFRAGPILNSAVEAAFGCEVFLRPTVRCPQLTNAVTHAAECWMRGGTRRHPPMLTTVYTAVYRPGSTG